MGKHCLGRCLALVLAASSPGLATPVTGPRTVLIAGDGSLPVFDDAVEMMSHRLEASAGSQRLDIERLSASTLQIRQHHAVSATLSHVLGAIASMKPGAGQGCFVFATSHGVRNEGLYLERQDQVLAPKAMDRALEQGCGAAPTVVVVSSCFSGSFVQAPMNRANRIILTAARADRTSFGCQAGRVYTVYDRCLLQAMVGAEDWKRVFGVVKACVRDEEERENVAPSEPQAWFGGEVPKTFALPMK